MNLLVAVKAMREEYEKIAHDLTSAERADLPKKDFAVPASKSNTGDRAYPIPDRRHAASALGFAKMHGDTADYAKVRAKVEKKFPGLIEKKSNVLHMKLPAEVERLQKLKGVAGKIRHGAEVAGAGALGYGLGRAHSAGKEKDSNMMGGGTPESYNAAKLPSTFQAPQVQGAAQMGKMGGALQRIGQHLSDHHDLHDVAGLGVLAIPGLDTMQAKARAALSGDKSLHAAEKRQLLGEGAHSALDVGGLSYLAAPTVAKKVLGLG